MKYLDVAGIKAAFAEHLKEYLDYSDEEAAIAVSDFPDPYGLPYLKEEYIGEECIDGVDYEMNASKVSFGMFGYD
ncbi:MAG: hypothetical protein IJK59_02265, partial [Firmicutes bacterium]|nr:hypothetical protein [Bacillota bacterium]